MKFPFSRFVVEEESMLPTFVPGDHVLTFNWGRFKKSDVVVFVQDKKCYLKRVVNVRKDRIDVAGDNRSKSRPMGPINKESLIGKVIWKYR